MQQYGPQYLNLGRKVPRSEIALRVSCLDAAHLRGVMKKWFVEKEPSFTSWGPTDVVGNSGLFSAHKVNMQNMLHDKHMDVMKL